MRDTRAERTTSGYAASYDARGSADRAQAYVEEILEADAADRARQPVPRKRRVRGRIALLVTLPILVGLTAFNVAMSRPTPTVPRPAHVAEQEARTAVYLAMQQVEAYRLAHGLQAPPSLAEVGADQPGLTYVAEGRSYSLTAHVDGAEAVFRSGDDPTPFEAAAVDLFTGGGS